MGVRINPCFGCPIREGCDLRDEWRERLAGLGLRTAWFVCPKLEQEIRPGRRVVITAPVCTDDFWAGGPAGRRPVNATITIVRNDHSFGSVVDPGQIDEDDLLPGKADIQSVRFRRRQAHRRIVRFLDEPDLPICNNGNIVRDGKCDIRDGAGCSHTGIDIYPPYEIGEVPF